MVGSNRPNQSHHHEGRQIRDANVQSGIAFADFESTPGQRNAGAAFPTGNGGTAATLREAGANTVAPAIFSATDQAYCSPARPDPSARGDSAKSNPNTNPNCANSERAAAGRR